MKVSKKFIMQADKVSWCSKFCRRCL